MKFIVNKIKDEIKYELANELKEYINTVKYHVNRAIEKKIYIEDLLTILDYERQNIDIICLFLQYKKWEDLSHPIRTYLEKRMSVKRCNPPNCSINGSYWFDNECIGETYDRIKHHLNEKNTQE